MAFNLKRVLVSDAVDNACVDLLKSHGVEVDCKYKLPQEQLLKEIKNYDGLIVRSDTKVTAEVLNAGSTLRIVGRAGTGVDNIDVDAATRKGIVVVNTPGGNSVSACELTCCLITCLARHVPQGHQSMKAGRWDRKIYMGSELQGKTLAVLGLGRIGREVARRMQAFGMKTIGFDPMLTAAAAKEFNVELLDLNDIWPQADYITVHTPLIPQTRNLINETSLKKCKKGVKIVNVARGGIIDEAALLSSLKAGYCGGAALDVFTEEPPKSAQVLELAAHPAVIALPHLGASTVEAQTRVAVEVAEQFIALKNPQSGYALTGIINAQIISAAQNPENTPWIELTKQLGSVGAKLVSSADLSKVDVHVTSTGKGLENMKFLTTAALVGVLSGRTKNGLNLINASVLAKEAGISVTQSHEAGEVKTIAVTVKAGKGDGAVQHIVQGSVQANGQPSLTNIDDAQFMPGIGLVSNLFLFQGANAGSDIQKIIGELSSKGITVSNIAIASGKNVWFAVQVTDPSSSSNISPIPGVITF